MVDFSQTQISQIQSVQVPQQPVVDRSGEILATGVANLTQGLAAGAGDLIASIKQSRNQGIVSTFVQDNLRIAQAVDQGLINQQAGRMRSRALVSQVIANNPALTGDILAAQKSVVSTTGLGEIISTGTLQEQRHNKLLDSAVAAGFPDSEQGLDDYITLQQSLSDLQRISKQNAALKSRVDLTSAQIGLEEKQNTALANKALATAASTYSSVLREQFSNVTDRLTNGQIDNQQAVMEVNQIWTQYRSNVNNTFLDADKSRIEVFQAPLQDLYTNTLKLVNGEITSEVYGNVVQSRVNLAKAQILQDPDTQVYAATSALFKDAISDNPAIETQVARILQSNTNRQAKPAPVTAAPGTEDARNIKNYMDVVKGGIKNLNKNDGSVQEPEKLREEIESNLAQVFNGVASTGEFAQTNPAEFNNLISFLSDPEVGRYLASNDIQVPTSVTQKAAEVVDILYTQKVAPLLRDEYFNSLSVTGLEITGSTGAPLQEFTKEATPDVIVPSFEGGAFRFVINPEADITSVDVGNDVRSNLRRLNNEVTPVVNNLVRFGAHVQQTTDYKATYEQGVKQIFERTDTGQEAPAARPVVTFDPQDADVGTTIEEATQTSMDAVPNAEVIPDAPEGEEIAPPPANVAPVGVLPPESGGDRPDLIGILTTPEAKPKSRVLRNRVDNVLFANGVDQRVNKPVLDNWAKTQKEFGMQLSIVSGYRDPLRNQRAGGAKRSQHTHGNAIDIQTGHLSHEERLELIKVAVKNGFTGIGVYRNNIHLDMGGKRTWGPTYRRASLPSWAAPTLERLGY